MAANAKASPVTDRMVRLGQIEFLPRNYKNATISVENNSYTAKSSRTGGQLIAQTGVARGQTPAPTHLMLVESEKEPNEFVLVPTNDTSEDYLEITWYREGRFARFHAGKLLRLKQMEIPEGTRMVVTLFPDTDSKHGQVVGMKLNQVEFVGKNSKTKAGKQPPASD